MKGEKKISLKRLHALRKATKGTVSDLQLIQTAVSASVFKINLNKLARLLKFAICRAKETEDVDVLVERILLDNRKPMQNYHNIFL